MRKENSRKTFHLPIKIMPRCFKEEKTEDGGKRDDSVR